MPVVSRTPTPPPDFAPDRGEATGGQTRRYPPARAGIESWSWIDEAASDLDEDALSRAFLGRLDGRFFLALGHNREAFGATRIGKDLVAFFYVCEPVIEERKYIGCDLFAQAIASAEVLIYPDLHRCPSVERFMVRAV